MGSILGSRRSPGGGHGNPLQYSCLENPRTEEPGGLQSIKLQTKSDTTEVTEHSSLIMIKTQKMNFKDKTVKKKTQDQNIKFVEYFCM